MNGRRVDGLKIALYVLGVIAHIPPFVVLSEASHPIIALLLLLGTLYFANLAGLANRILDPQTLAAINEMREELAAVSEKLDGLSGNTSSASPSAIPTRKLIGLLEATERAVTAAAERMATQTVTPTVPQTPVEAVVQTGKPTAVELVVKHLMEFPDDAELTTRELADKLGVSHMSVARAKKKLGI